jgi:hypothetical protein
MKWARRTPRTSQVTFGTVRQCTRPGNGTIVLPAGSDRGAYPYDGVECRVVGSSPGTSRAVPEPG